MPQCGNNSLKNPALSFHKIPKDDTLRKKSIKPRDYVILPTTICYVHLAVHHGGRRTYDNNTPTKFNRRKSLKQRRNDKLFISIIAFD